MRHRRAALSTAKRQGFGSFHSEDIELLIRTPQISIPQRLLCIRNESMEEFDRNLALLNSRFNLNDNRDRAMCFRNLFSLTQEYTFLNHGAFGGALSVLSAESNKWRIECEKQPLRFFDRDLFPLLASSLQSVSQTLNCNAEDLLPLPNVTTGLNALTHSIELSPSDEVMLFSLSYGSTKKIVKDWTLRHGATMRTVHLPLPVLSLEDILKRISQEISSKTKVVIIDQVTSNTAMLLPVREIAQFCKSYNQNISVIVDAAHSLFSQHIAIHQRPLDSNTMNTTRLSESLCSDFENVDYWLTNAHKWLSAPKGAAVLWVNPKSVHHIRPAIVSHGFTPNYEQSPRAVMLPRGKFLSGFSWDGCRDYGAFLTLSTAISVWNRLEQECKNKLSTEKSIRLPYAWGWYRQRIQDTLNDAETIFKLKWNLRDEDFVCPYEMRCNSPMRLVSFDFLLD